VTLSNLVFALQIELLSKAIRILFNWGYLRGRIIYFSGKTYCLNCDWSSFTFIRNEANYKTDKLQLVR